MNAGEYLIGWVVLAAVFVPLAFGAWSLRAWLIPEWSGALARLTEAILAVATLVLVAETIGTVQLLNRPALVLAVAAVSAVFVALGARARRRREPLEPVPAAAVAEHAVAVRRTPRLEIGAATVGVALVAAQWAGKVAFALSFGMTHPDTLWYHGPYAALFAQRHHSLVQFDPIDPLHAFANHTSELLHGVLVVLTGRDILSPVVNVGWFALVLLAAWCLGQRFGAGALCVLAAAVVLGLPTVEATHPGQGSNDVAAAALLLSAVALLVAGNLRFFPTTTAAVAAGLAVSTKITTAAPVVILTVGVIFLAIYRKRFRVAAMWCGAAAITSFYWFARNIRVAHNPLAYYDFRIGPIHFHGRLLAGGESFGDYLFDARKWRIFFRPGLHLGFGWAYPVVLAIALAGVILGVARHRNALLRITAIAYFVGLVSYVFTPYTADNHALSFRFNVRYIIPSMLGAIMLFGVGVATRRNLWRRIAMALMLAVIVIDLFGRNYERVPAWPRQAASAAPAAVLGVGAVIAIWYLLVKPRRVAWLRALLIATVVGALAVGWPLQRHYFNNRYVHSRLPIDAVTAPFRNIRNSRVAVYGSFEAYPFYGPDLSNKVDVPGVTANADQRAACHAWLRTLSRYKYVVVMHELFIITSVPEPALAGDPAARRIASAPGSAVYRVDGPLLGKAC